MGRAGGIWPSRDDYQSAVLNPQRNLKDTRLHDTQVEMRSLGALKVPFPRSGNFGAVYKFSNKRQAYALKVFDKAQPDRELRYKLIDLHLESLPPSPNLVTFGYEDPGILVNGRWYPALVMDWVEGVTLDHYLSDALRGQGKVDNRSLCQAWVELILGLEKWRVAHGDLQHGNILVLPDESLKLVDYDGMFVPEMGTEGLTAAEIGLPAYQHPKRYRGYFDERLDNFAGLVILLSLACLNAERWQRYHTDDNCLLVREADLIRPQKSALFADLLSSTDRPVRKLAVILKAAAQKGLDEIPSFSRLVLDETIKQLLSASWKPSPYVPPVRKDETPSSPLQQQPPGRAARRITNRDILSLLIGGETDEQVARKLSLSPSGLSNHINKLMNQAGAATRHELVAWAIKKGVKPPIQMGAPPADNSRDAVTPASQLFQNAQQPERSPSIVSFIGILITIIILIMVILLAITGFSGGQ